MKTYARAASALIVAYPLFLSAQTPLYQVPAVAISAPAAITMHSNDDLGSQTIISNVQIQQYGATSLQDVLNHIAGVEYTGGVSANPQVFIRGEQALILINGVPLSQFSMTTPDLNLIDIQNIQEIIVTTGSDSVEYGDEAIGGSINIITKTPKHPQLSVKLTGGYPQMGDLDIQASNQFANGWSAGIGGEAQYNQGYRDNSESAQGKLNGMVRKTYDTGYVDWRWQANQQAIHYPGVLTADQMAQDRTQSIPSTQGFFNYSSVDNLLHWHQDLADAWTSDTVIHQNQLWGYAQYGSIPGSTDNESGSIASINQSFSKTTHWFDLPTQWTLGANAEGDIYHFTQDIDGAVRQSYAAYVLSDWTLPAQFGIALGGRYVWVSTEGQFYNDTTNAFSPTQKQIQPLWLSSVELYRHWAHDIKTYIRRAQSYQLPEIDQSSYGSNMVLYNTGFGLEPQTATSYETGLTWSPAEWQWNLEAYLMNVKNEIAYVYDSSAFPNVNINLPPTRHIGLLLSGHYMPIKSWGVDGQLSISRQWFTEGAFDGNQLPQLPNWLAMLESHYDLTEQWSVQGQVQYTGSEFADSDFNNAYGKVSGYWVVNTGVNYRYHAWLASFQVDNLTNTYYNLYTTLIPGNTTSAQQMGYFPAPARTFLLSVQYALGA